MPKRARSPRSDSPAPKFQKRTGATSQVRARVLRAGSSQRNNPPNIVFDSSEDEIRDVLSPMRSHVSDSGTDNSSLHSRNSPQRKSRAEMLADKYNPGTPAFDDSDIDMRSESNSPSLSPGRPRSATQKRPWVLTPKGKDFKLRTQERKAIVISEDEAPESAQPKKPTPITPKYISNSDTDDSSLHGERSPRTTSTAEMLARKYQDALVSDIEAGHDHTTKSPSKKEENNRESYSIQFLAAEEQKIALELGGLRKEREQYDTKREQCKTRETYLAGVLIDICKSKNKLADSGL
ncbi:hypothetical protein Q7P35_008970 [Cladosporium inversicolor]